MAQPHIVHPVKSIRKLSRQQWQEGKLQPWQQLHLVACDQLAFRSLILRREGRQTLQNIIFGHHGLPNRW